jgi:mRNA interferase RelE/StbE
MSERPTYSVEFDPRAWDEIMALPEALQRRVFAATDKLEVEPRPAGVEKMKGEAAADRVRVGDYRIIYEIHDTVLLVVVFNVGHRREVYRKK